jgi:hypothetical protein
MPPLRAAMVAVALLLVPSGDSVTKAASQCLSKSEARTLYPRKHLYWSRGDGQRCWSDRRGGRARFGAVKSLPPQRGTLPPSPRVLREAEPLPTPRLPLVPPELVPVIEPPKPVPPPPLPFDQRWIETGEAEPPRQSRSDSEREVIFSTFQGAPPDVWPALRHQPSVMTLFAMLLSAAVAFAAGARSIRSAA